MGRGDFFLFRAEAVEEVDEGVDVDPNVGVGAKPGNDENARTGWGLRGIDVMVDEPPKTAEVPALPNAFGVPEPFKALDQDELLILAAKPVAGGGLLVGLVMENSREGLGPAPNGEASDLTWANGDAAAENARNPT